MRALLFVLVLSACEDETARRQVAALVARVETLEGKVAALHASAPALTPTTAPEPSDPDPITIAFVQAVRTDPARIARASGMKLADFVNEDGLVFGPGKLATALRKKSISMYGAEGARSALIDFFGPEIGSAVFYSKIHD